MDRIPADQLTAYERWELPVMDANGNEQERRSKVREEEVKVKPLTAQDLEAIRQEAWNEGQQEGIEAGRAEGLQKGHQEGYAQGFEQGRGEGEQKGQDSKRAEIDAALRRLESVAADLMEPLRKHQDEIEQALLNVALAVSRSVIRREVSLDSQQIKKVVTEAMSSLPRTNELVRLQVNPQDAAYVKELAAQQQENWTIIELPEILPGGCKVETRHSLVDYTIEKRFQLAVQQMLDRHTAVQPPQKAADLTDVMEDMTNFHRELLETPAARPVEPAAPSVEPAIAAESVAEADGLDDSLHPAQADASIPTTDGSSVPSADPESQDDTDKPI